MNPNNEYNPEAWARQAFLELRPLLERFLDFERWGFQPVFSGEILIPGYGTCHALVYQSECCKVRFLVSADISIPDISSEYGRLHVPVDRNTILWNGEKCICWHSKLLAAQFLEGIPSSDARKMLVPPVIKKLAEEQRKNNWSRAEYTARYDAAIWGQYGQRFFDLYDVRQTTLWNSYLAYCQEYYGESFRFDKPC